MCFKPVAMWLGTSLTLLKSNRKVFINSEIYSALIHLMYNELVRPRQSYSQTALYN